MISFGYTSARNCQRKHVIEKLIFLCFSFWIGVACQNGADEFGNNDSPESDLNPTEESVSVVDETFIKKGVSVIPEQDSSGIYWGLRDTSTGALVLGYAYQKIWEFKEGFALVLLNGKFGLINAKGKIIVHPDYDFPKTQLECGVIAFEIGYGPIVIFDTTGTAIIPFTSGVTGILPCQKRVTLGHYQFGMLDLDGDTILPFKFRTAYLIDEGYCVASLVDKSSSAQMFGLYDLDGNQVLSHEFESIDTFYNGLAIVKKKGKYGVIDNHGKELFYTDYSHISGFSGKYAIISAPSENEELKVGIMDRRGREVVPPIYQWLDHLYNFSEGRAAMAQNRKYGFVDTSGTPVISFKYERVESFKNGIAKVWLGRNVGYIDRNGEEVISCTFPAKDQANLNRYHDQFIIGLKDSVQHIFDFKGNEIATLNYERVVAFNENEKSFLALSINKWGVLDSNFNLKIPFEYEALEQISSYKIAATKNNKVGFIDRMGVMISPFYLDWIEPFQDGYMNAYENGLMLVSISGKKGVLNSYGKLVVSAKYDEIYSFLNGLAIVHRDSKFGFVDVNGKEVIRPIYDAAEPFNGYSAEVTLKGETFQIDRVGNRLEEEY